MKIYLSWIFEARKQFTQLAVGLEEVLLLTLSNGGRGKWGKIR